jgi:hypothetical protein
MITAARHMLTPGELDKEPGADYRTGHVPAKQPSPCDRTNSSP